MAERKFYLDIDRSNKDAVLIGTDFGTDGKIIPLGKLIKRPTFSYYVDLEFDYEETHINKQKLGIDEALELIGEFMTKADVISLACFLWVWGK